MCVSFFGVRRSAEVVGFDVDDAIDNQSGDFMLKADVHNFFMDPSHQHLLDPVRGTESLSFLTDVKLHSSERSQCGYKSIFTGSN